MSLRIGDKITISENMSEELNRRYNEECSSIDYQQRENIYGRADFSGRTAIITDIKYMEVYVNRNHEMRTKFVLNISKSQVFDEEFLIPFKKPVVIPLTVEKKDNTILITDSEEDAMTLTMEEIQTLINSEFEEGIFGNIEIRYIDLKIYVKKLEDIIVISPKDLEKFQPMIEPKEKS